MLVSRDMLRTSISSERLLAVQSRSEGGGVSAMNRVVEGDAEIERAACVSRAD